MPWKCEIQILDHSGSYEICDSKPPFFVKCLMEWYVLKKIKSFESFNLSHDWRQNSVERTTATEKFDGSNGAVGLDFNLDNRT